jgi:hypothetical protein
MNITPLIFSTLFLAVSALLMMNGYRSEANTALIIAAILFLEYRVYDLKRFIKDRMENLEKEHERIARVKARNKNNYE